MLFRLGSSAIASKTVEGTRQTQPTRLIFNSNSTIDLVENCSVVEVWMQRVYVTSSHVLSGEATRAQQDGCVCHGAKILHRQKYRDLRNNLPSNDQLLSSVMTQPELTRRGTSGLVDLIPDVLHCAASVTGPSESTRIPRPQEVPCHTSSSFLSMSQAKTG